jgi:fructokinase
MGSGKIVTLGEVLWDDLPTGRFLGGAPLNVAVNLKQLGLDAAIISAIGRDELGDRTLEAVADKGLSIESIQRNEYPTSRVQVQVDEHGSPSYTILEPVAWDYIKATKEAGSLVQDSEFIVIGSLAFRNKVTANSFRTLLAQRTGKCVVDVNFRKPFYNRTLVQELLGFADVLKLNDEELPEIQSFFNIGGNFEEAIASIAEKFGIETVLYTRGKEGSTIFLNNRFAHANRFEIVVKDTVGAGDAFLAGAIFGLMNTWNADSILEFANAMGAYVAASEGATPALSRAVIHTMLQP